MKNKKLLIAIASGFAALLLFFVGTKLYQGERRARVDFLAKENAKTFVPDHAVRMGAENPEVYLVEYLDPECESCRQFYPLVKSIMNEFEGKIQLVVRYAPFHQNSVFAIRVLEAARLQGKYWETLELLFQHQPEWGSHHDPRPELIWHYLPRLGLDIERLKKDMDAPRIREIVEQDRKDGEALGVHGTPTFFVNGKPLEEFGYQQLRQMVARELEE